MNKVTLSNQPATTELKAGQFYQFRDPKSEFDQHIFLLCKIDASEYCLIDLADGEYWHYPQHNIRDVFEKFESSFHLIQQPFTITPNL